MQIWYTPRKLTWNPKTGGFYRCFLLFLLGVFSGSMLVFGGIYIKLFGCSPCRHLHHRRAFRCLDRADIAPLEDDIPKGVETQLKQYGCFQKLGVPQHGWFIMENPIKMDDLGVPLFSETSVWNCKYQTRLVTRWWLNQPILKNMFVRLGIMSPRFGVKRTNIWKPPPRHELQQSNLPTFQQHQQAQPTLNHNINPPQSAKSFISSDAFVPSFSTHGEGMDLGKLLLWYFCRFSFTWTHLISNKSQETRWQSEGNSWLLKVPGTLNVDHVYTMTTHQTIFFYNLPWSNIANGKYFSSFKLSCLSMPILMPHRKAANDGRIFWRGCVC